MYFWAIPSPSFRIFFLSQPIASKATWLVFAQHFLMQCSKTRKTENLPLNSYLWGQNHTMHQYCMITGRLYKKLGLLRWLHGKESACQWRRCKRCRGFNPWVGKIPWSKKYQPTPVFLPGKSHGQRSLAGYIYSLLLLLLSRFSPVRLCVTP